MRCQTVRQKLEAYAAEEVAPHVRKRISRHMRSCLECREALARRKELEVLLRSVPAPAVPDGFADRVMGKANVQGGIARPLSSSGRAPLGWLGPRQFRLGTGIAAALAVGLLIGGLMARQTWQRSVAEMSRGDQVIEADPVGASGLSFLAGLGDMSLGEAYLGLTGLPNNRAMPDDEET